MRTDFFELGGIQAGVLAGRGHPLNSTAPLLDQVEFVEHAPNHPVPQLGDTLPDVLNRQAERQETGILDLDAVVEHSYTDRSTLLGIVRMNDGIHERLPNCNHRDRPAILPAQAFNDRFASQVFFGKRDGFVRGTRQERPDFN